ncbi:MAG: FAD-dependent oxidoreductase [candidate division NC10 bacterium]|nr:FAD-dependent oxidoreductase [candidate division NC10 bacterium]
MATRHVIVGGGTAGLNAIRTIRAYDRGESEVILVSAERPYSRMVLPYYLGRGIAESHVFTATPAHLAQLQVQAHLGRRAASLDTAANRLTLDDGTRIEYDDLLIATGSSAVKAPVPGADSPGVHSFWTLEQARGVVAAIREGSHVVLVGAEKWLRRHGVAIRTGATLTAIEEAEGRRRLRFREGEDLLADVVLMATGIRTNLEWLNGSAVRVNRGIVVDDHLRSSVGNVYAAGDVAEGLDLVTGQPAVHAIEPTAMEHGRVAGANMAGQDLAYRGSLLMNIVEVCHLDIASFGAWDDPTAEAVAAARPDRWAYRKLLWKGDRLIGAMILGMANDIWTTNDVGMLKGLVQAGNGLGAWKAHLRRHPFDIKPAFIASGTTARLLPETILGRPSVPVGQVM